MAGVVCNGNATSVPECEGGEVRMVGGEREGEGRVEVCVDGFWGSVCGDGFDQKAAFVICREFGYSKLLTSQHNTLTFQIINFNSLQNLQFSEMPNLERAQDP